jgi:ABC-type transport system involved in multi-copper enzyme maturation permease subunit
MNNTRYYVKNLLLLIISTIAIIISYKFGYMAFIRPENISGVVMWLGTMSCILLCGGVIGVIYSIKNIFE